MIAIETVALSKRFRRVQAVQGLNLEVPAGSVFALMGPNGAGKTTFIKLLMNLISPSSGAAMILGQNAEQLQGARLEDVGYVSENQKMPDWMTAGEFLSYWRPFYSRWDADLERRLVQRFELPLKSRLKSLSRGTRMKVALTSVLAFHPRLMILDEPLSGLDPLVRNDLMEALLGLSGETTVLFSSHDLAEIESFASHVGYMDHGRMLLSDPIASIRERFRKIEAVSASALPHPAAVPAGWLEFRHNEFGAAWSEAAYDESRTRSLATEVFGPASDSIELRTAPMTLREVFLAMASISRPRTGEPR